MAGRQEWPCSVPEPVEDRVEVYDVQREAGLCAHRGYGAVGNRTLGLKTVCRDAVPALDDERVVPVLLINYIYYFC